MNIEEKKKKKKKRIADAGTRTLALLLLLHDGKHARHASELNRLYSTSLLPTAHNNINVTRVQSSNTFPPVKFTILRSATPR